MAKEIRCQARSVVRHSPKQIVEKLQEADRLLNAGQSLGQVLAGAGGQRGDLPSLASAVRRDEGRARPAVSRNWSRRTPGSKKLLADAHLDNDILKSALDHLGNGVSPARRRSSGRASPRGRRSCATWPEVSERRACRALGQPRSTQRYQRRPKADEGGAAQGDRSAGVSASALRLPHDSWDAGADGFKVGRDRVYRLWRTHGYGVKQKQVKKRRLGVSENGIMRKQGRVDQRCLVLGLHSRSR